jgi:hypothetical protein
MPIIVVSDSPRHQQRTEFLVPVFRHAVCQVFRRLDVGVVGAEQVDAGKPRAPADADGQRSHTGRSSRLGHHATVAADRSGAITAAVKKHDNVRVIAARDDRPLSWYAAEIDRCERHVAGHRPDGPDLVDALAPLGPPDGARLGAQQSPHGLDFVVIHRLPLAAERSLEQSESVAPAQAGVRDTRFLHQRDHAVLCFAAADRSARGQGYRDALSQCSSSAPEGAKEISTMLAPA